MKILHVLDHSIPLHSGYTFRTRSILKQQHALGWETAQVTSPKHGNQHPTVDVVDDLTFYRSAQPRSLMASLPGLNQLALIAPLEQTILEAVTAERPDVIHAHSPALNGMAAIRTARKTGLPVVYEIRAFWEDAAVDHGTCKEGDIRYRLTRAMENYVIRHVDKVTTICEGLRSDLIGRGVSPEKITVIPNAVNIEQFQIIEHKDASLIEQLKLQDKKVLGFLGSFYGYEGLDLLVAALPEIKKHIPNIVLLLVGGGVQEQNLRTQIKQLGIEQDVIMPGRVPHELVADYYSLVDLLVYPRKSMRLTELVTPLKPLEAMAQGKLVLASDVGGHKELIKNEQNGWLFKADDIAALVEKAVAILSDDSKQSAVKSYGRQYVENERNWYNSVQNYTNVYGKIIDD